MGTTAIIASWNAEKSIQSALKSALAQENAPMHAVVVDDASTDNTAKLIPESDRITYVQLTSNSGPSAARNAGLDICKTEWAAVLDSDDKMTPERIETMIAVAHEAKADIVLGNFMRVDENGAPVEQDDFLIDHEIDQTRALTLEDYLRNSTTEADSMNIGYLKPLFNMSSLRRLGLRYDETLRNSEDLHLILRAIVLGARVVISKAPHYLYTVRQGSISYTVNPKYFETLLVAEKSFVTEFNDILSPEARTLLEARRRMIMDTMEGEVVMQALKTGDVKGVMSALWKRPATITRVFKQICESISKRVFKTP